MMPSHESRSPQESAANEENTLAGILIRIKFA
jgi:hypothetical protein